MRQKHKKNVRFNLRMTTDLHDALKAAAKKANWSVSNLVRVGMFLAIEKYGQTNGQVEQGKGKAENRV